MSNPLMYGGQKISREPYRPSLQRAPDVSSGLAAIGSALGEQSALFTKLGVDFERSRGDARTLAAANELATEFSQKRTEYLKRKGSSADGIVEEASKWMDERVSQALENDKLNYRDKSNLKKAMTGYIRSELELLGRYQGQQMAIGAQAQKEMLLQKFVEQVAADPTNPSIMGDVLPRMDGVLYKDLRPGEEPNELIQKERRDWRAMAHANRIAGFIDLATPSSLKQANYFLSKYTSDPKNPEIPAQMAHVLRGRIDALKEKLKREDLVERSQVQADKIMGQYQLGNLTESEAKDKARELSGELRDATLQRVSARIADQKATKENAYVDLRRSVYDTLVDTIPKGAATVPKLNFETEKIVEDAISELRPEDQDQARAYVNRLIYGDVPNAANDAALTEYHAMSMDDLLNTTPANFEKRFRPRLTDSDWKIVSAEHRQILLGNMTAATWQQRKTGFISSAGLATTKEKKRAALLTRLLDKEYERRSGDKKAPLTGEEMDQIIGDFSVMGSDPHGGFAWIFSAEQPYWEALLRHEEDPTAEWVNPGVMDIINGNDTLGTWYDDWYKKFKDKNDRPPTYLETQTWLNQTSDHLLRQVGP